MIWHDEVKHAVHDAAHGNYYDMRCEVYGLFLPVLNQAGRVGLEGPNGKRGRSGLIPDFMDNNVGAPTLLDVEGITLNETRHAPAAAVLGALLALCSTFAALTRLRDRKRNAPFKFSAMAQQLQEDGVLDGVLDGGDGGDGGDGNRRVSELKFDRTAIENIFSFCLQ